MENENMIPATAEETEQNVQETENEPKKSKKQLRKEKKRAKKQARKQLRREIRQRKKDEFRAKGCLGKIFWFFGKIISLVCIVAVIAYDAAEILMRTQIINRFLQFVPFCQVGQRLRNLYHALMR